MKRYYSVRDASKILGFSTNTIYKYLDEGKLQSKRVGRGRFKIPYSELEQYLTPEQKATQEEKTALIAEKISDTYYEKEATKYIEPEMGDNYFMTLFISLSILGGSLIKLLLVPQNNLFSLIVIIFVLTIGALGVIRTIILPKVNNLSGYLNTLTFISLIVLLADLVLRRDYMEIAVVLPLILVLIRRFLAKRKGVVNLSLYQEFTFFALALVVLQSLLLFVSDDLYKIFEKTLSLNGLSKNNFIFVWQFVFAIPALSLLFLGEKYKIVKSFLILGAIIGVTFSGLSLATQNWLQSYYGVVFSSFAIFVFWWSFKGAQLIRRKLKNMAAVFTWMILASVMGCWVIFTINNYQFNIETQRSKQHLSKIINSSDEYFSSLESSMLNIIQKNDLVKMVTNNKSSSENYQISLERLYNGIPNIERVILVDEKGSPLATYPKSEILITQNYSSTDYFTKTKLTRRGFVSGSFDTIAEKNLVAVTQPLFLNNDVIAVLVAFPNIKNLSSEYKRLAGTAGIYAFDYSNKYLIHPDPAGIGQSVPEDIVKSSKVGFYKVNGNTVFFDSAAASNWTFFVNSSFSEAATTNKTASFLVSLILLVNAIVSISASMTIVRKVERTDE